MSSNGQTIAGGCGSGVAGNYFGKYRGLVSDNQDPLSLGRLKARVPEVLGEVETGWALPCAPYAGSGTGLLTLPPVGAGVWIEFEAGCPTRPIWAGCWWGTAGLPMGPSGALASPDTKTLRSEQGLLVTLDDSSQTVTIGDANGQTAITIEVSSGQVTVKGMAKVVVDAPAIELTNGASHPLVKGDQLLQHLTQLTSMLQSHVHPGQTAGPFPVTPAPPQPTLPTPSSSLLSQQVKTG